MPAILKIMSEADWALARRTGCVPPATIDLIDGFIHLSTEQQALETARRHFAGRDDLVAVSFDADLFGDALKWEASRGGALFPHVYAELPAARAIGARRLRRLAGGGFEFGEEIE